MDRFFRWLLAAALPYRRAVYRAGGFLRTFDRFHEYYTEEEIEAAQKFCVRAKADIENEGLVVLCLEDEGYPAALREIFDPPPVLFATAPLPQLTWTGIVGTRKPSPLTLAAVRHLVRRMPRGRGIVSGFARGVDFEAHREAIECGVPTAAVLGSGVLVPTPDSSVCLRGRARKANTALVLVSEFLPSAPAMKYNFPRRNRIIAGMSEELLLLQAPEKSGSLITAKYAMEEGREIYVFDHPLLSAAQNAGGRRLLFEGAELLESPELAGQIVKKPEPSWPPGQEQLEFFRKKHRGLRWLRDDYYIEE